MGEQAVKVGDVVRDPRGRLFRVVGLADVFGIPAADLVRVRKSDGAAWVGLGRRVRKNLPVSGLEAVR